MHGLRGQCAEGSRYLRRRGLFRRGTDPVIHMKAQRPFIKLFQTARQRYVYDVNTNRILAVDACCHDALHDYGTRSPAEIIRKHGPHHGRAGVKRAIKWIEESQRLRNVLLPSRPEAITLGLSRKDIEAQYAASVKSMSLDLTERCNLRCHYCGVDALRPHPRRDMPEATALSAIDFLHAHSRDMDVVALRFYGGEPLLRFELITRCVCHALAMFGRRRIRFHMVTNGLLLDADKAAFLAKHGFHVAVSVDGTRAVHDRHRLTPGGKSSYRAAVNGLRRIVEAYGAQAPDKVTIFSTFTPPYDLKAVSRLRHDEPWLSARVPVKLTYVNTERWASCPPLSERSRRSLRRTRRLHIRPFARDLIAGRPTDRLNAQFLALRLNRIFRRRTGWAPRRLYPLNACCVPGVPTVFVTVDGELRICENACGTRPIGSIEAGYDLRTVWRMLNEYAAESIRDCRRCWAVSICTVCFAHVFREGRVSIERKRRECRRVRGGLAASLKLYCTILEENPRAFEEKGDIGIG